ncbi:MAG: hypothetical protein IPJ15_09915 [Actinomycetales bacterium]|nr:hypothetical protein [Candidatus Phosphoribacter baldrii]HRC14039.1 hypothetical protein [Dermatophilaceae bacterium]
MIPLLRLGIALASCAALGACGLVGTSSAPTTATVVVTVPAPAATAAAPSGTRPAAATTTAVVGPTIDGTGHAMTAWDSPTGNIVCAAFTIDVAPGYAIRCDVMEHTWKLPPKPADCEFDWGHGTYLEAKSGISCVSDAIAGSDVVGSDGTWWNGKPGSQVVTVSGRKAVALAYGASLKFGPIVCTSQPDGMHCTNTTTKAGFDISRAAYTLR